MLLRQVGSEIAGFCINWRGVFERIGRPGGGASHKDQHRGGEDRTGL